MATTTHQITCAHDDCPEYSITCYFKPGSSEERATEHRRRAAADGWTDYEGRDYCPDHNPNPAV